MDKKIFLVDKSAYRKELVESLTEKDLEEWVAEDDYNDNYSIIKIDASAYSSIEEALSGECVLFPDDYYMFTFGF